MGAVAIKHPALFVLSGPLKGKKYPIKQETLLLGNGPNVDVNVPGEKVARLHAEILKDQFGSWQVKNSSDIGILVNKKPVDKAVLNIDDIIQIGEATLFKFQGRIAKATSRKDKFEPALGEKIRIKKPVAILLGVYLLLLAAVAIYLSIDIENESVGLENEKVQNILDETETYLTDLSTTKSVESLIFELDKNRELSSHYYNIRNNKSTTEKTSHINNLMNEIDRTFFRAWRHENTGNLNSALEEYNKILNLIPDNEAPTTKEAKLRIKSINEKIDDAK